MRQWRKFSFDDDKNIQYILWMSIGWQYKMEVAIDRKKTAISSYIANVPKTLGRRTVIEI